MKRIQLTFIILALSMLWAPPRATAAMNGTFLSVKGKVSIQSLQGTVRQASGGMKVAEGESIVLGPDGRAALKLFDGSRLNLAPGTRFVLDKLEKPSSKEKQLRFTLELGSVQALVQKLLTASSHFEIAAGGVVCGVRGTRFTVTYLPDFQKVTLKVDEGTVYAETQGQTYLYHAGQAGEFLKGKPVGPAAKGAFPAPPQSGRMDLAASLPDSLSLEDFNWQFDRGVFVNPLGIPGEPTLGVALNSSNRLGGPSLSTRGVGIGTIGTNGLGLINLLP